MSTLKIYKDAAKKPNLNFPVTKSKFGSKGLIGISLYLFVDTFEEKVLKTLL